MECRLLIFILIAIPDPIQMKIKRDKPMKINRAIYTIPQRKFLITESNDPKQIMAALNSLPKAEDKVRPNYRDYFLAEIKRLAQLAKMNPKNKLQSPRQFDNAGNNQRTPKYRRISEYVLNQIKRAANRNEKHDPKHVFSRKRYHNHDNPNSFLKAMSGVPDLESMIPEGYVKSHPKQFKKFHGVIGKDVSKYLQAQKKPNPIPAMQYGDMSSMTLTRKSNSELLNDILNKRIHTRARRRGFYPVLNKDKLDHVGNSLLYVHDKRILGSHSFPKKKHLHAVYGNLDSLGLKAYPDSIEIRKKKFKKYKNRIPNANKEPELLFNQDHPGLNLLYDKKMWLEAAKFAKSNKHLVYGNLNNLGVREGESNRYQLSDFRRSNNLGGAFFHRLNDGRWNHRPVAREEVQIERAQDNRKTRHGQKKFQQLKRKTKPDTDKKKGPSYSKDIKYLLIARNDEDKETLKHKESPKNKEHKKVDSKLVYGNTDNVGIHYGNRPPYLWKYTDFRKRPLKRKPNTRTNDDPKEHKKNPARLVYGNAENTGIRYGKEPLFTMYSDFRKRNDLSLSQKHFNRYNNQVSANDEESENVIMSALKAVDEYNKKNGHGKYGRLSQMIALEPGDLNAKPKKYRPLQYYLEGEINEDENGANEILESGEEDPQNLRRSKSRNHYTSYDKHEDRNKTVCSDKTSSSSSSSSGSDDRNPGNPYTIFKNKYKQNWPWNHFMDGDHMNINPYGPKFDNLGPTGNELFFGRKWWYFNQDDYKPFRKR